MVSENLIDLADTDTDTEIGRKVIEGIRADASHLPRSEASSPSVPFMIIQDEGQWSPEEIEWWGQLRDQLLRIGQPKENEMTTNHAPEFTEIDLKAALEVNFSAGQGAVQLSATMTDEQILSLIKSACSLSNGMAFKVIPPLTN